MSAERGYRGLSLFPFKWLNCLRPLPARCSDSLLPDSILETSITGLTAALENKTADAIANATVKVTVELNESNVLSVNKAVVVLAAEEETVVQASLNGEFAGRASQH